MSDSTGITTGTFTNRNNIREYNQTHTAEDGEPGSSPADLVNPDNWPAGYDLPSGPITVYSQPEKREIKNLNPVKTAGGQNPLGRK